MFVCFLQTGGSTQYLTRLISEAEAYLTSVERLTEFEEGTPQEASTTDDDPDQITDIVDTARKCQMDSLVFKKIFPCAH